MKTLRNIIFVISFFLLFSSSIHSQTFQTVNGWNYVPSTMDKNIDFKNTKTYFSTDSKSQIFNVYGTSVDFDSVNSYYCLDLITNKNLNQSVSTGNTTSLEVKLNKTVNPQNIEKISIFISMQNSEKFISLGKGSVVPMDSLWNTLSWSMQQVTDFQLLNFTRFYIDFRIQTKTPNCYVGINIELRNLKEEYDNYSVIFDKFGDITSVPELSIPSDFVLYQNYPNPFNPTTSIKFDLPKAGNVILKVYNVLGEEVATLVNDVMQAGHQEVKFDATRLASGMYIYRIQAGSFVQVKKMLLMK